MSLLFFSSSFSVYRQNLSKYYIIHLEFLFISEKPKPVKGLQAVSKSSKVMELSWQDIQDSNSVPVIYHVYHSLGNKLTYCGNTTEKSIKCSHLKPDTKYMFYVRRNDEQINATVSNFTAEDSKSDFRLFCMYLPICWKQLTFQSSVKSYLKCLVFVTNSFVSR